MERSGGGAPSLLPYNIYSNQFLQELNVEHPTLANSYYQGHVNVKHPTPAKK